MGLRALASRLHAPHYTPTLQPLLLTCCTLAGRYTAVSKHHIWGWQKDARKLVNLPYGIQTYLRAREQAQQRHDGQQ